MKLGLVSAILDGWNLEEMLAVLQACFESAKTMQSVPFTYDQEHEIVVTDIWN